MTDAHAIPDDSTSGEQMEPGVSSARQGNASRVKQNKLRRRFALFVLGGSVVLSVIPALVAAYTTNYLVAALCVGSAVFCFIPFVEWLYMARFVARGVSDSSGTTLRPDQRFDILQVVLLLVGIVVWGSWAAYLGIANRALPDEMWRTAIYVSSATTGILAVFLWLTIKRRGGGYLRLSPEGFVFAEGMFTKKGRWSEITAVTDVSPERTYGWGPFKMTFSHAYPLCPVTVVMANGKSPTVSQAGWYASDGDALRELVRFYWQRPQYRVELTDDRALQRLRDGQFNPA